MITITIPFALTDLNTYINKERCNRYAAAKIKKDDTESCRLSCIGKAKIINPVKVTFIWVCKDERKDPDNIAFAKKFILDGMVTAGIIKDDGWKEIKGFEDKFEVDKDNPRVVVEIREMEG